MSASISLPVADLSKEDLAYLVERGLVKIDTTPAPQPQAETEPAPAQEGWTNVVGYPCSNSWTAFTSSTAIKRHLAGTCGCKDEGSTCKWAQKGRITAEEFGTRPGVKVAKDEANRTYVWA